MPQERRKVERLKGRIRIGYGQDKIVVYDLTDDFSEKGTFVKTPYPLDKGMVLQLEVLYQKKPEKKNHTFSLQGRVERLEPERGGMLVDFIEVSEEQKKEIALLLKTLRKKR